MSNELQSVLDAHVLEFNMHLVSNKQQPVSKMEDAVIRAYCLYLISTGKMPPASPVQDVQTEQLQLPLVHPTDQPAVGSYVPQQ